MTYEEAIKHFKSLQKRYTTEHNGKMCEKVAAAIEALEKQIPKKPKRIDKNAEFDGNWIKVCPSCGTKLVERFTTKDISYLRIYHACKYCDCGQALDWSNE